MKLIDKIWLEADLIKDSYLSIHDIVLLIQNEDNIDRHLLLKFLENINISKLNTYSAKGWDTLDIKMTLIGVQHNVIDEFIRYLDSLEGVIDSETNEKTKYCNEYSENTKESYDYFWARTDLLQIQELVDYTDIVSIGDRRTLRHFYSNIIDEQPETYAKFTTNAQRAIQNLIKQDTDSKDTLDELQIMQSENEKLQRQIAELEKKLENPQKVQHLCNCKTQDYKIIALMAILLADKEHCYKSGKIPNSSYIANNIQELATNTLNIDSKDTFGLASCNKKITASLNKYSVCFNVPTKTIIK